MSWSTSVLRVRLAPLTGLSPPVKYFTDRSKAVLLLWIFNVFVLSWVCYVFVCVCFYVLWWSPAGKGLTSWLSFVVSYCEFVTFPLVSWVRCGTWLYRFLIFAPLLTLIWAILSEFFKYSSSIWLGVRSRCLSIKRRIFSQNRAIVFTGSFNYCQSKYDAVSVFILSILLFTISKQQNHF